MSAILAKYLQDINNNLEIIASGSGGGGGVVDIEDGGAEVATLESINGQRVYSRLFSWTITGAAMDPPGEQYSYGATYNVIRANAWVDNGTRVRPLPYVTGVQNDMTACVIDIDNSYALVYDGGSTFAGYTLYVQIWYTK